MIFVDAVGTPVENGTALKNAMAGITPMETERWLIKLGPGTYDVGEGLRVKSFTTLDGSGQLATAITANKPDQFGVARTLLAEVLSELREVTIENTGGGANTTIALDAGSGMRLTRVTIRAFGGAVGNFGLFVFSPGVIADHITASANGGQFAIGAQVAEGDLQATDSFFSADMAGGGPPSEDVVDNVALDVAGTGKAVLDRCHLSAARSAGRSFAVYAPFVDRGAVSIGASRIDGEVSFGRVVCLRSYTSTSELDVACHPTS